MFHETSDTRVIGDSVADVAGLFHISRNDQERYAKAVAIEGVVSECLRLFGLARRRRWDVIVEPAVLVVGDKHDGLTKSLWILRQRRQHTMHEELPLPHVTWRMIV